MPQVLEALSKQTFKDFEVIAVDDNSTDKTVEFLKTFQDKLDVKIYQLPKKFSYAYSCNFGAEKASGEIIGYLSGHSVPIFNDYIKSGLKYFASPKIAGVFGTCMTLENASTTEKIYYSSLMGRKIRTFVIEHSKAVAISKPRIGLLGNTNSLMRRKLWQVYNFSEEMAEGGEDVDWAFHFLNKGYVFVKDPRMTVKHSHGIGFKKFIKQHQHWLKIHRQALRRNGY